MCEFEGFRQRFLLYRQSLVLHCNTCFTFQCAGDFAGGKATQAASCISPKKFLSSRRGRICRSCFSLSSKLMYLMESRLDLAGVKTYLILFGLPMSYYRPKMTRDSFDPLCLRYLSVLKVSGCDRVCMRGPMVLVVIFECELEYAAPCHTVDSSRSNRSVVSHDNTSALGFSDSSQLHLYVIQFLSPGNFIPISIQLHLHRHRASSYRPISISIQLHLYSQNYKSTNKLIPGLHPKESFHQHHRYGSFRTSFQRQLLHLCIAAIYYQSKTGDRPLQCLLVGLQ